MQIPLRISFCGMSPSSDIEVLIREQSTRIERFCDRILGCQVVVDVPHRHEKDVRNYAVHLDITTPEHVISVTRDADADESGEDLQAAVADAFDTAKRHLEGYLRRRRTALGDGGRGTCAELAHESR